MKIIDDGTLKPVIVYLSADETASWFSSDDGQVELCEKVLRALLGRRIPMSAVLMSDDNTYLTTVRHTEPLGQRHPGAGRLV
jgi:hypothetical protein